jgi:ABC-2 type transport system ATP-binding protein
MTYFDVNSLFVKVGKKPLLSGISFRVVHGHILSLSGQNGSGKTSLLKVLSGLCLPSEGKITYSKKDYKKIFFSNEPQFISNLTALKNIELYTIFYGVPFYKEDFLAIFEKYLPLACASLLVNNLSTGQKRLLSFVLLEILKPELIFLDEPTHGLDQYGLERFLQLLDDIKKRKSSIFFIATHDKNVLAISDDILNVEQYKYIPCIDASSLSSILSSLEL